MDCESHKSLYYVSDSHEETGRKNWRLKLGMKGEFGRKLFNQELGSSAKQIVMLLR